jgi:hypothetical protein
MAFNIQKFADNVAAYGSLQTNRFEVDIPRPRVAIPNISETLTLRADRVDMPGVLFDHVDTKRYGVGPMIKTPANKTRFNEVSISFIETKNGDIYKTMSAWLQRIIDYGNFGSNVGIPTFLVEYKKEYAVEVKIRLFNSSGTAGFTEPGPGQTPRPMLVMNLAEAFPISLGDTNLSWSDNNQLFRTTVVFAYTYHQLV